MFSYSDLYGAWDYACFCNDFESAAYVNVKDEKIVVLPSEENAEPGERKKAEQELKNGEWTELPRKRDLGLGRDLVFRFAEEHLSVREQRFVAGLFSRSGAYGNWRDFLESKDLLIAWHQFEDAEKEKALKEWLTAKEIPFRDAAAEK